MSRHHRFVDFSGKLIGRLTVMREVGRDSRGNVTWLCQCSCGGEKVIPSARLRGSAVTQSCGCIQKEDAAARRRTHGASGSRLYGIWSGMRKRCSNPKARSFKDYGARGITIDEEWADFTSFQAWALANGYADDLSIERLDVNRGYSPDNCCWIPPEAQSANRNYTQKAPDGRLWSHIARENGISAGAFKQRVHKGWDRAEAASRPVHVVGAAYRRRT